ncbi:tyrosine-trna ligase [Moniliophthora roreri]|nr:tyrosine-trna ligase [Moniliophthora roreri]
MAPQAQVQFYRHGRFRVQGGVLPDAVTAYCTYGDPADPCIVFPTCYGGRLDGKGLLGQDYMIGPDMALDPSKYFIVTFALFCNGEASPDCPRPRRTRLLPTTDHISRQCPTKITFEHSTHSSPKYWASKKCSVSLASLWEANRHTTGRYPDLNAFLREVWEFGFLSWDANDLLALMHTWQTGDVSTVQDGGDLGKCLTNIKAKGLIMPCKTDLYFPPEDNDLEVQYMKGKGKFVVIDSIWGHMAGGGSNESDHKFIQDEQTEIAPVRPKLSNTRLDAKSFGLNDEMLGRTTRFLHATNRLPFQQKRTLCLYETLTERGYIQQATRPDELKNALASSPQIVYAGIDPTARSLHIGHLLPFMCLLHFQLQGHDIIPLIGGATGLVGDPSGRKTEREPADVKLVESNVLALSNSIKHFFRRASQYAHSRVPFSFAKEPSLDPDVKSNLAWHKDFNMLEFLRIVGIHARAYDFYYLHEHHRCTIQIGGSDQWGNILAGLELIGRLKHSETDGGSAFGVTTPLLTTASGEKFGKSAGNAVWLDPQLTSVFDFYQYFLKVEDADVEKYLKLFTLLPLAEIKEIVSSHKLAPEKRIAQRRLADEVTELVHQKEGVEQARRLTKTMFRSPESRSQQLDAQSLIEAFDGDPRLKWCSKEELTSTSIMKLASRYGLVSSTSAARQLIQARGLYVNDKVVPEIHFTVQEEQLLDGRIAVIRAGKDKILILGAQV